MVVLRFDLKATEESKEDFGISSFLTFSKFFEAKKICDLKQVIRLNYPYLGRTLEMINGNPVSEIYC